MNNKTINILHVEDDPDLQKYVSAILSDYATITAVGSLQQARALISDNNFDLVIMDFTLPDGSGTGLVSELAQQHPSLPVIAISAHDISSTMINIRRVFLKGRFRDQDLIDTVLGLCP